MLIKDFYNCRCFPSSRHFLQWTLFAHSPSSKPLRSILPFHPPWSPESTSLPYSRLHSRILYIHLFSGVRFTFSYHIKWFPLLTTPIFLLSNFIPINFLVSNFIVFHPSLSLGNTPPIFHSCLCDFTYTSLVYHPDLWSICHITSYHEL